MCVCDSSTKNVASTQRQVSVVPHCNLGQLNVPKTNVITRKNNKNNKKKK